MTRTVTETLIGAAVLAVAIGFIAYASGFLGGGQARDTLDIKAQFSSVEGIGVGTDVRMGGVKIGAVTGVRLSPETYLATASMAIDAGIPIPDDSFISIESEGLLGGSFVEILPGASDFVLNDGDEIEDTQSAVSLLTLLLRYVGGDGQ